MASYHPAIWRTCRVLANPRRIACLKAVLKSPGACVGELAALAHVGETYASLALRSLQARGLIAARRESRWVRYFPEPDPLVPAAAAVLDGLRDALLCEQWPTKDVVRLLTAFTHPRRLTLLRDLQTAGPTAFAALVTACGISPPALYRHLKKLERRQLVRGEDDVWSLASRPCPLAAVFLRLIAQIEDPRRKAKGSAR